MKFNWRSVFNEWLITARRETRDEWRMQRTSLVRLVLGLVVCISALQLLFAFAEYRPIFAVGIIFGVFLMKAWVISCTVKLVISQWPLNTPGRGLKTLKGSMCWMAVYMGLSWLTDAAGNYGGYAPGEVVGIERVGLVIGLLGAVIYILAKIGLRGYGSMFPRGSI